MQPNETCEFTIDDLGMNGEGIAHKEGATVFIPYALKGERVRAKLTYLRKGIGYAELKEVVEASPDRVTPPCNRFTRCGGCTLMHCAYPAQLEAKRAALAAVMKKNAGYTGEILPVVPSEPYFGYRNKVQLPFGEANGEVAVGFYREGTRKIVSVTKCFLHGEWLTRLISVALRFARENGLSAYSQETKRGLLRHLVARMTGGKLCVTVVINGRSLPNAETLKEMLAAEFDEFALYLSPNTKDTGVVMGEELIPVYAPPLVAEVNGVKLEVNPFSFFQVNDDIREKVYAEIARLAGGKDSVFVDAYAGIGLTGAAIAKEGGEVYNIEIVPEAVRDADKLYSANGLSERVHNVCGDANEELKKLIPTLKKAVSEARNIVIYIDPPRKGISAATAETLNALACEVPYRLIYLSCNPATLSRDIALLTAFEVRSVRPFDMFPHSGHLESLVLMSRRFRNASDSDNKVESKV